MKITNKQKDKIIADLQELWDQNWEKPLDAVIGAMKESIMLVTNAVNERLRKFNCGSSVTYDATVEDAVMSDRLVHVTIDPIYSAHIRARFSIGGYPKEVSVVFSGCSGDEPSVTRFVLGDLIKSLVNDKYDTIERLVYDTAETNGLSIINLKETLELPPMKLFELLASIPGKFADMVQERLDLCESKESENAKALLEAFGLKPNRRKRKRTVFRVSITKEELDA